MPPSSASRPPHIPVVDPERERGRRVAGILHELPDNGRELLAAHARELPPAVYPVSLVSLSSEDPVGEARYLARHLGCESIVFYGDARERERWGGRISYEPLLPSQRVVVPVEQSRALLGALTEAISRLQTRHAAQPLVRRVEAERSGLRAAVEEAFLDALDLSGELRDTYAAVIRGSLQELDEGEPEEMERRAGRAFRSALRRIELLRGPSERDRVARALGSLFRGIAESGAAPAVSRFEVADEDALDEATGALAGLARSSGFPAATADAMVAAAERLARGALDSGRRGVLELSHVPGSGRLTVTWRGEDEAPVGATWAVGGAT